MQSAHVRVRIRKLQGVDVGVASHLAASIKTAVRGTRYVIIYEYCRKSQHSVLAAMLAMVLLFALVTLVLITAITLAYFFAPIRCLATFLT